MAAAPSIKITNRYAIKNPDDPDYNANKQVNHYIRKKWVMVHSIPKAVPQAFHDKLPFRCQIYKMIICIPFHQVKKQR